MGSESETYSTKSEIMWFNFLHLGKMSSREADYPLGVTLLFYLE